MGDPTRVLVIDDDDIARELIAGTLRDVGLEVYELTSAIGATREIFAKSIDVVVIDVMMPDINGDKLAKVLRGNSRGDQLVIILVSSRSEQELQTLAQTVRVDGVVNKARIRRDLNALVKQVLQERAAS